MTTNERFPAFTGLGMYPYVYTDKDGNDLCPGCARADYERDGSAAQGQVYWEGPVIYCAVCGHDIDSAYGTDEDEEAA